MDTFAQRVIFAKGPLLHKETFSQGNFLHESKRKTKIIYKTKKKYVRKISKKTEKKITNCG